MRRHNVPHPIHAAMMAGMYLSDREGAIDKARLPNQTMATKRSYVDEARACNRQFIRFLRRALDGTHMGAP